MDTKQVTKKKFIFFEILVLLAVVIIFGSIMQNYVSSSSVGIFLSSPFSFLTRSISDAYTVEGIQQRYDSYISDRDILVSSTPRTARSIPILMYHAVLPTQIGEDHSREEFENHMFALKAAGYNTITVQEYYDFMQGKISLPTKSFLLTFDDGRAETMYPVDPYLRALEYSAAILVITGHLLSGEENPYYLNKRELQEAELTGRWEIQSHGRFDHDPMIVDPSGKTDLFVPVPQWLVTQERFETQEEHIARVQEDLVGAKKDIEDFFGKTPLSYSFPKGDFGRSTTTIPLILNIAKEVYPINFFQVRPDLITGYYTQNYQGLDDMGLSRRIKVPLNFSGDEVIKIVEGGQDKSLPYAEDMGNSFQWVRDSRLDRKLIQNGEIHLLPYPQQTNTHIFLDGTRHWKDYTFSTTATLLKGKTYKILARAVTGQNYAACVYYKDRIRIQQMIDGTEYVISEQRRLAFNPYSKHQTGIQVQGNTVGCLIDGRVVLESVLSSKLPTVGGIGFKVWDPVQDNSYLVIHNVQVEPIIE